MLLWFGLWFVCLVLLLLFWLVVSFEVVYVCICGCVCLLVVCCFGYRGYLFVSLLLGVFVIICYLFCLLCVSRGVNVWNVDFVDYFTCALVVVCALLLCGVVVFCFGFGFRLICSVC